MGTEPEEPRRSARAKGKRKNGFFGTACRCPDSLLQANERVACRATQRISAAATFRADSSRDFSGTSPLTKRYLAEGILLSRRGSRRITNVEETHDYDRGQRL